MKDADIFITSFNQYCRLHLVVYSLQDILMMFDDDKVKGW